MITKYTDAKLHFVFAAERAKVDYAQIVPTCPALDQCHVLVHVEQEMLPADFVVVGNRTRNEPEAQ